MNIQICDKQGQIMPKFGKLWASKNGTASSETTIIQTKSPKALELTSSSPFTSAVQLR